MSKKEEFSSTKSINFANVVKNGITGREKEKRTRPEKGENFQKPGHLGFNDGSKKRDQS